MNMVSLKRISFSAVVLLWLAFIVTGASAAVLSIENGQVIAIGSTASMNMTLDSAPTGLAGYSINVTIGDPSVANIISVSFPAWAILNDTTPAPPNSSCRLKATDLNGQVQDGATNINLATVTIRGLKGGVTPVNITLNLMNDDDDVVLTPTIVSGTFTVNVPVAPTAAFTANTTSGTAPLVVQFTDQSTGTITAYAWDFTDDGTVDSSDKNVTVKYTTAGLYTVNLTVTGPGGSDSEVKTNYINVTAPTGAPVAAFTANTTSGTAPLVVQFTDQSTGTITAYAWDFTNDGTVDSTAKNASFTYTSAGLYTVNRTVTGPGGSGSEVKTNYITVTAPGKPVAAFIGTPTSGYAPLTVQFTDQSSGNITSYAWDFNNDGRVDSTMKDPAYKFTRSGTYTVKLTIRGPDGMDEEIKEGYINVGVHQRGSVTRFTQNKWFGYVPLTVQFTVLTPDNADTYLWNFGDGTNSTEKNPIHTYSLPGYYSVRLTTSNEVGSSSAGGYVFVVRSRTGRM
jgi:PKD repeat protein